MFHLRVVAAYLPYSPDLLNFVYQVLLKAHMEFFIEISVVQIFVGFKFFVVVISTRLAKLSSVDQCRSNFCAFL